MMTVHLSETKLKLLERLRHGESRRLREIMMEPAGDSQPAGALPLSRSQLVIWTAEQLFRGTGVNNVGMAYSLRGIIESELIGQAVAAICRRHEMLRSGFEEASESVNRRLFSMVENPFEIIDLRALNAARAEDQAAQVVSKTIAEPFDLTRPPLIRVNLIRKNAADNILVVAAHHICADAWSLGIFCEEISEVYNALLEGRIHSEAPPVQYFKANKPVSEHRKTLENQAVEYFKEKFSDAPPALDLPLKVPRPPVLPLRIKTHRFDFTAAERKRIADFSGEHKLTAFTVLLSSFQLVLGRFAGQTDVTTGVPVTVRETARENAIGCFINVIAVRSQFDDDPSFLEFLKKTNREILDALKYREMPVANLTANLKIERTLSRNPLFQTLFSFQNVPSKSLHLNGAVIEKFPVDRPASPFDLGVYIEAEKEGYTATVEYLDDLLSAEIIEEIFESYRSLLFDGLTDPHKKAARLEILPAARRLHQIHRDDARFRPLDWHFVDRRIGEIAASFPEKTAVGCGSKAHLNYRELQQHVENIAAYLNDRQIGRGKKVGVLLGRGVHIVPALLGVLASGAAYIPLDPNYPPERLRMILDDARPEAVFTEKAVLERMPDLCEKKENLIILDDALKGGNGARKTEREKDDSAYIIYTSGSTGKPKGVEIGHHSLANLLQSMTIEPGFGERDTMLAVTTISFDISALELFLPLTTGGRLLIADEEESRDPWLLLDLLEKSGINNLQSTPSRLTALFNSGWRGNPGLRVWCGGEKLSPGLARRILDKCGCLYNLYGPTETTIWSTVARIENAEEIHIGRPIANTNVYIADENGKLVPDGVRGEILIGGIGVAKGYFGGGALEKQKFVEDLYSLAGGRLFKTGDIGRRHGIGQIEIFDRRDSQIKLRGFRIELSEIDDAICAGEEILAGRAFIHRHSATDEPVLAAAVVAKAELNKQKLLENLRRRLPDYMIPKLVVEYDELPTTPSGKIDRKALIFHDDESGLLRARKNAAPPSTEMEQRLADIFAEFASLPTSVADDFFSLGGNSLSAVRLLARIRTNWNAAISLKDFINSERSLVALIELIEQNRIIDDDEALWRMLEEVETMNVDETASAMKLLKTK